MLAKNFNEVDRRYNGLKRIGRLGCGAIGSEIAIAIDAGRVPAKLTHVFDFSRESASTLVDKLGSKPVIVENAGLLAASPVDVIVEAASQDAVRDNALSILQNRKDLMVMSAGALLDESIFEIILEGCRDFGRRVYLPTGAIAGLDAIRAVRDELESVRLVNTKSPRSLQGARFFETSKAGPEAIMDRTVLYDGAAEEAVRLFPANVNVAALLSLAGIGSQRTRVRIVADPATDKNTHEIEARGRFGVITIRVENVPSPANPKTSRLAILSAIECLRDVCGREISVGT